MPERILTDAEINDLTGDDVAYWLANPFLDRELIHEKVRWWISRAVEATAPESPTPPVSQVHNHPPYRPSCNERHLPGGQLRGACLNDDGSDR